MISNGKTVAVHNRKLKTWNFYPLDKTPLKLLLADKIEFSPETVRSVTNDTDMTTIVMSIKQMLEAAEQSPEWNVIMMTALLAMIPPVFVVIAMQKLFVKGLTETDK